LDFLYERTVVKKIQYLTTLGLSQKDSISMALVGLLESLLIATIIDDLTGTESNKNQEVKESRILLQDSLEEWLGVP
jgi:hypothetical protein